MARSGVEAVVRDFVHKNWEKLGIFEYFFPVSLIPPILGRWAGDATVVVRGEVVGIEFEGNPYEYFHHGHHKRPEFERVQYVFCHTIADEYDEEWATKLRSMGKTVMSLSDLEKLIAEGAKEIKPEIKEGGKRKMEDAVEEYFRTPNPSFFVGL